MRAVHVHVLVWVLVFTLLIPSGAAAETWFDQFGDDLLIHDSGSWESQQRGYFAAGGISYRTRTNREPIFSITPPKMQIGCGGIDSFWGGFSFLNPEYLVKMFQNILQAAPAFAFKLALSSLCTQCDDAMSSLNSLANSLNSLAMDECKASQALTNLGGDSIASMLGAENPRGENKENSWLSQSLGMLTETADALRQKVDKVLEYEYCYGITNHDDLNKCKEYLTLEGSLWEKVKEKEAQTNPVWLSDEFIAMVRGMFGDIIFVPPGKGDGADSSKSTGTVNFVTSCETEPIQYINAMLEQSDTPHIKVGFRYQTGECVQEALPVNLRVGQKAKIGMDELFNLMATNPSGDLSEPAKTVIGQSSLPIYQIINTYAFRMRDTGQFASSAERQTLTSMAALGHALFIMNATVNKAYQLITKNKQGLQNARVAQMGSHDSFEQGFAVISDNINQFKQQIYHQTNFVQTEFQQNMQTIMEYTEMRSKLQGFVRNKGLI